VEFENEGSRKYVVWSFRGEKEITLRVNWSKVKVTSLLERLGYTKSRIKCSE